jgi:hypothetical protein
MIQVLVNAQVLVDTLGGDFAILHRDDSQVITRRAVASCPHIRQAGALIGVYIYTTASQFRCVATAKWRWIQ